MFIERMKKMKLHTLLHSIAPFLQEGDFENPEIHSIENNSQKVTSGALFVCIKGYSVDGHDYAEAAVGKGAVAVLAEKELSLKRASGYCKRYEKGNGDFVRFLLCSSYTKTTINWDYGDEWENNDKSFN